MNGKPVVAFVDTGSAEVIISESCFEKLELKGDNEVEYIITSATYTNRKLRKVLIGVEIAAGKAKGVSQQ